jgi:hypothetical protein
VVYTLGVKVNRWDDAASDSDGQILKWAVGESKHSQQGLRPIAYASLKQKDAEMEYHANDMECPNCCGFKKFRSHEYGRRFSGLNGQLNCSVVVVEKRMSVEILQDGFSPCKDFIQICHVKVVDNFVANALSRNPNKFCIGPSDSEIGHGVCVLDSRKPPSMNSTESAFQKQLDS